MFWGETSPMPPLWTGGILALILLAGTFVLLRVSFRRPLPGPGWLWQTGMWAMIAVFTLRGVLGFLPSAAGELQPFIRLNKVLYSPLCLVLAVLSTLAITVKGSKISR